MYEPLVSGGTVRRLWIGEAEVYGKHLLRLDAESRGNRFGGAVSGEFIRRYAKSAALSDVIIYGFFVDEGPPERRRRDQRDQRYERLMSVDNWR